MDIVLWGSVVIVILLAAGGCVVWVRARFLNPLNKAEQGVFSLDSLERLYAAGQLSREEFRRLRNAALGLSSRRPAADQAQASEPAQAGESAQAGEPAQAGELAQAGEPTPTEGLPPAPPGDKKPPGELSTPAQDDDGKQ